MSQGKKSRPASHDTEAASGGSASYVPKGFSVPRGYLQFYGLSSKGPSEASALGGDPVQAKAQQDTGSSASTGASIHEAAQHGISGPSGSLPYMDQIQKSFGRHDVSQVKAHVDGRAEAGAQAMGAVAFATGDHVAFAGTPSLHTAAHEAAHVVQQRAGVQLKGGVGEAGDQFEQHADAVADRVVRGESSEALLDGFAGGAQGHDTNALQRQTATSLPSTYGMPVFLKAQTAPPGSGYQDKENAYLEVKNLFKNGAVPAADDLVNTIYRCTLAQRTALRNDADFLGKVVKAGYSGSDLLRVLEKLILEPVKLVECYAIKGKFGDTGELRRILADANVAQRLAIIRNQKVCERLHEVFSDITPQNLFGTDVTIGQKAKIANLPWYRKWAEPKPGDKKPTDVDTEKGLADVVSDREALAKNPLEWVMGLMLGTAPQPSVKWADLIHHLPRGKALNASQRAALDKCALELADSFTITELLQLFEIRFGCSLVDGAALGEKHKDYDRPHIQHLWGQLQRLPPEHVTQQLIRKIGLYDAGSGSGGAYNDLGAGHGTITLGDAAGDPAKGADWAYFEATTRHEVGHAVDVQVGGFERFTAKCKAQWRRYKGIDAFVAEFIRVAGGDAKLKAAAIQLLSGSITKAQWNTAVDGQKSLKAPKGNVKFALANVAADYTVLINNPLAEVNGRKFCSRWGDSEYMSWAVAGEDTAGISDYAYNSWAEFFAETYSKWFDGKAPNYDYGKNLPKWVETAGFGQVVGHQDPAKATKKGSGTTPKGK